jgi:hypothetical protein
MPVFNGRSEVYSHTAGYCDKPSPVLQSKHSLKENCHLKWRKGNRVKIREKGQMRRGRTNLYCIGT